MMDAVLAERERCAKIAEGLAERWEASAERGLKERTMSTWFGLGKRVPTLAAVKDANTMTAAAHGLRAVAGLIRDGVKAPR